jgi:hypothetical protein
MLLFRYAAGIFIDADAAIAARTLLKSFALACPWCGRRDPHRVLRKRRQTSANPTPCCGVIRPAYCGSIERLAIAYRQPAARLRYPGAVGPREAGAKMTATRPATWQLRTLPPTYIVCPLIET